MGQSQPQGYCFINQSSKPVTIRWNVIQIHLPPETKIKLYDNLEHCIISNPHRIICHSFYSSGPGTYAITPFHSIERII